MLAEGDLAKFTAFRARAMGQRPREMCEDESYDPWTFEEKVREMTDAEEAARQARRVARLVREARFREPAACVEDMICMPERKLGKDRVARLAECSWPSRRPAVGSRSWRRPSGARRAGGCCPRATSGRPAPAQSSTGRARPRAAPASG